MKKLILLTILTLISVSAFSDVLYLNEGEEHVGVLQKIDEKKISFKEAVGEEKTFEKAEVSHVLVSKVREGDQFSFIASLTDPFLISLINEAPTATDYPDSDYVTLFKRRSFEYQADGSVVFKRREIVKILKEDGLGRADQAIYYTTDREVPEIIYAHTYAPDGRIYHLTDDALSDEALYSGTPEYDRLKKIKFAMKKVDLGGIIDVCYQITTKKSTELRPYLIDTTFGQREPILKEEFVVSFPQSLNLGIEKFQWTGEKLPVFSETLDKQTKTWTWVFQDKKGFIPEQNMMPGTRIFPRILVFQTNEWNRIADEFEKALDASAPSKDLLESFIADSKAAAQSVDVMKVESLYDAILRKIRLLDISCFDYGGIDPVHSDVALKKKYGNNMARVCLLHFALKNLGIKSAVGFVNYWDQQGILEKVPEMGQAGFAMLKISVDGVNFYTTCDSDYLPFGNISTSFQGTIGCFLGEKGFTFERIPEGGAEPNRSDKQVFVKILPDGSMEVKEIRQYRGPYEVTLRTLRAAKERQKQMYAEKSVKRVHPKAQLESFGLSDINDLKAPTVFTLSYKIPQAAMKVSENLMTFRNLWVDYNSTSASLATRTFPMEYWASTENVNTIVLEVPEGYTWVPWGKNYSFNCGCMNYFSTMSQTGYQLVFSDRFDVRRKEYIGDEVYQHYRSCLTTMSELANQWIILEKLGTEAPGKSSETVPAKNPGDPASPPIQLDKIAPEPQG